MVSLLQFSHNSGNVAFQKSASQGPHTDRGYVASQAIDGSHSRTSDMRSCSRASSHTPELAWWEVDLGDDYVIKHVSITPGGSREERKS